MDEWADNEKLSNADGCSMQLLFSENILNWDQEGLHKKSRLSQKLINLFHLISGFELRLRG
jgi:hypothetical protein